MFIAIPPFYCIVYRLTTLINNDFSASDEGEVTEVWGIVSFGTPCRYDTGSKGTRRRSDGIVDTGSRPIYFEPNIDVRAADRILVNNSLYKITSMEPIYGFDNEIHHYEGMMSIIDWAIPDYLTQWVDEEAENNIEIIEKSFSFNTTSPLYLATVNAGDFVNKIGILTQIAFDDITATLSIGEDADHESLMETDENIPTAIRYAELIDMVEYSATTEINLYISPEASTVGSGHVFIEIIRSL